MNYFKFALVVAVLMAAQICVGSTSFPAGPPQLAERWRMADLVVEADVLSTVKKDNRRFSELSIRTILKNKLTESPDRVTAVSILGGCPYDFVLKPGMRVILFLRLNQEDRELQLYGAGSAAIEVDDREFRVFADAFEKLPAILDVQDDEKRYAMLADWYVELMKAPESRWEGSWGITCIDHHLPGDVLNQQQCEQLIDVLKYESPPAACAGWVIKKVLHRESHDLDRLLLDSLSQRQQPAWQSINEIAVEHLPDRLGIKLNEATRQMLDKFEDLNSKESDLIYLHDDPETAEQEGFGGTEVDREEEIGKLRHQQEILWREISQEVGRQCRAAMGQ